ncbi:hypothetical protein ACFLY5_00935 [Patescibacteria group bacterium]
MLELAKVEQISQIMSNPAWDVIVMIFFLGVGFFYGLLAGRKKMLSVLFSIYISILLLINFSYLDFFVEGKELLQVFLFRAGLFLVLILLLSILFNKTIFRVADKKNKWWQIFLLSFLEVGLLTSAMFQLLPAKDLFEFSPVIETVFASSDIFFWWLTLPLVALFFILRKKKTV